MPFRAAFCRAAAKASGSTSVPTTEAAPARAAYKLSTPVLVDRDVQVVHIQPDGSLANEAGEPRQLTLF